MTARLIDLSAQRALRIAEFDALVVKLRELEEERGITMADSFLHEVERMQPPVSGGLAPVVPIST